MGVSINGVTMDYPIYGFIMENPTQMDDLGLPLFEETAIWSVQSRCLMMF